MRPPQKPTLTGAGTGTALSTDLYRATGLPTSTAVVWVPLGVGATLHAPRGFVWTNATCIWLCDTGYGLRRLLRNSSLGWNADPVNYIHSTAGDFNVTQAALLTDGITLYVTTPKSLYGFNTATLAWLNAGAPLLAAATNTEFRGGV